MPIISGILKKTDYDAKIIEIESNIPIITDLTTDAALTAVTYCYQTARYLMLVFYLKNRPSHKNIRH